jgi:hypothetical protein
MYKLRLQCAITFDLSDCLEISAKSIYLHTDMFLHREVSAFLLDIRFIFQVHVRKEYTHVHMECIINTQKSGMFIALLPLLDLQSTEATAVADQVFMVGTRSHYPRLRCKLYFNVCTELRLFVPTGELAFLMQIERGKDPPTH